MLTKLSYIALCPSFCHGRLMSDCLGCSCILQYMTEASWNWRMMKHIFTELHVYDEASNYVAFDYEKEEPFYWLQRKVLPSTM